MPAFPAGALEACVADGRQGVRRAAGRTGLWVQSTTRTDGTAADGTGSLDTPGVNGDMSGGGGADVLGSLP